MLEIVGIQAFILTKNKKPITQATIVIGFKCDLLDSRKFNQQIDRVMSVTR